MLTIEEFRQLNDAENMVVTQHSRKRMSERGITLKDIFIALGNGEVIEQYPQDYPFPSCLVLGTAAENQPLHVVASIHEGLIYLITAYFPDSSNWESNMKTRKGEAK